MKGTDALNLDESLVVAFERVAMIFSSRIALGSERWEPTYQELNQTANRLAHRLIACGVSPGDRIAILMAHDAPMVAAVLGALKAGQIIVALDPGDALPRLKTLVEDAEPSVVVTDVQNRELAAEFARTGRRVLNFEIEIAAGLADNPSIEIPPAQTACLTYTSGTTGRPRGVMKTHRQLRRAVAAHTESMLYTENDRNPLFSAISTGQGMTAIWWTLLNGAMLCPFPLAKKGVTGLADWIVDRGLTTYASSASVFRTLVKTIEGRPIFSNVHAVWLASESITADDFRLFRKHFPPTCALVHGLSSSETSNIAWSRWTQADRVPDGVLPVGHFSRDMDVALVGDDDQPVARGEVGDIVVTSRYVAAGYWRDPDLTAERFSAELDDQGTRRVRSGDRGRINADGLLEFCGRAGDYIKVRGNRIALADVERTLAGLDGIDGAAIIAVPRQLGEPMLVAFVVKASGASWTAPRLRQAMRACLSLSMVPSQIVFLDRLPFNRGNKIDREALRQHALPMRDDIRGERPRTETEVLLADIWADIFALSDIRLDEDFFGLGGDSLIGALVAARVHAALGVELTLGEIADHPTVAALAAVIDKRRRTGVVAPPIVRVPRAAHMPLSLFQEAMWPGCRRAEFTNVQSSRILGPLDVEAYKECLRYLVNRHEILRTTIGLVDDRPVQIIHPSAPLDFSIVDLTDCDDPEGRADEIFCEAAAQPIDLETLPIMRHVLAKIADDHYRLARINSFMIVDGFSARILERELAALYEAKLQGRTPAHPAQAPLHYADYAVWQRQITQAHVGPYLEETMAWWEGHFASRPPATKVPLRRWIRRSGLDPSEGVLRWMIEGTAAKRLDEIARHAGTTHFVVRLAAFAALVANMTGNPAVAIGTFFDNRNRAQAQAIVGRFVNWVPLVFSYDSSKTFVEWLQIVHARVFETLAHSELPFDTIQKQLQAKGIKPPETEITFMLSRDNPEQQFGNLAVINDIFSVGTMPWGCMFYVDEKAPVNCHVRFDANRCDQKDMRALLDRYLRLLEAVARQPAASMGTLLTSLGAKPPRLMRAMYAARFRDLLSLKSIRGASKTWLSSRG
jgi:amino acid adenylation domain-containing protein